MQPTLIFDMDGIIVDTTKSYCRLLLECYKHFANGEEITIDEVKDVKRLGGYNNDWDVLALLFKQNKHDVAYKDIQNFYFERYCDKNFEGYINIEEPIIDKNYIEELSKNFNLTIFTGRFEYEARYTLKRFGILDYFSQIICFDQVGEAHQKPDPKGVNIIKSNITSERIYYMGDTVDDMLAAKAGGVLGVGCLPPQDKSQILIDRMKEVGAYAVLNSTKDLIEFLKKDLQTVNA